MSDDDTATITLDAATLARAWLSVALASGKDVDVPVLDRTIAVEQYPTGVRLVATDRYVMLRSWVPAVDYDLDDEPDPAELPDRTCIVYDEHGRAKGFMTYLLGLHKKEDAKPSNIVLTLGLVAPDDGDDQGIFAGLDREWVVLDYPNHERLRLIAVQDTYPDWRRIFDGFKPVRTSSIALNPEIVGRLAKLGPLHDGAPLVWEFGGADKLALLRIGRDDWPPVSGGAMPVRLAPDAMGARVRVRVAKPGADESDES